MIHWLNVIKTRTEWVLERTARARTCELLQRYDDRLLRDLGYSRERLNEGVAAWPWRSEEDERIAPLVFSSAKLPSLMIEPSTTAPMNRQVTCSSEKNSTDKDQIATEVSQRSAA